MNQRAKVSLVTMVFLLILLALVVCAAAPARAATFEVTNLADTSDGSCTAGDCSLREAITAANSSAGPPHAITFAKSLNGAITLTSALPDLNCDMTIAGPGAGRVEVSGNSLYRIFNIGAGKTVTITGLTLRNGLIDPTPSYVGGGAIRNWNGMSLTLTNCILRDNSATSGQGGAIYSTGSLTLTNCTLSGNSADRGGGGAISSTGRLALTNCTLSGNFANNGSGAIEHSGDRLSLIDSTLSGNSCGSIGGAIATSSSSTVEANNCVFSGNSATKSGGAIMGYTVTLANCTINGNTGGVAIFTYTSLTLTNCTISNNTGTYSYGAICCAGALRMTNCTISGNSGTGSTGGVYSYAGASYETTLTNCTISGNSASPGTTNGGGFFKAGGIATLTNCTINGNSVSGNSRGGGVAVSNNATVTLTNCTISGNSAAISGGGVWRAGTGGALHLRNSIVAGNSAATNADVDGTLSTDDHNLIGGTAADAGLEVDLMGKPVLQDNGGSTKTIALVSGSPAIDAGNDVVAPPSDQRGYPRHLASDKGAFEYTARICGRAYNFPVTPSYRASFAMDAAGVLPTSPVGWLYYYSKNGMNFVSTRITKVTVSENAGTISGSGKVDGASGYSFTATIEDGALSEVPDTFGIVIWKKGFLYTEDPKPIAGGDLTVKW